MTSDTSPAAKDDGEEIFDLVETLHRTEQRLEELTSGQVDSVVDRQGQTFFLRRAQVELRFSESVKQAAILNALPAQIALVDLQGIIISVNDSWRRFAVANVLQGPEFGIGQNYVEICERSIGDFSGQAHAVARGIRQVLEGMEKEFTLEYPCHSPTEKCWFRLMVTPVKYDHSAGAVVMHLDITQGKLADEALRESEERFRGMFAGAAAGIAISTPKGRYLQVNAAYCRMLGYTEAELRTMNFASVTHPDDLDLNLEMRDQLLAGQRESLIMEKRYMKKDGGMMWAQVSVSATHTAQGEMATLIVIAEDITERKLAEEQLRSKTALLEAQVNSTLDGILIVDSDGNKILQNQRMVDLWHIPQELADDPVDQRQFEWVTRQMKHPREFAEKIGYLHAHPDEISRDELALVDGRFFDRYSSPVRSKDGTLYGRIWAMRDITESKQAAEQLRSKTALLEAQLNSTPDGIIVTDGEGKMVLQNHKMIDLWNPPQEIFDEIDHRKRMEWVAAQVINPRQFSERVAYIYAHPNEIGHEELELINGKIFDRYIAPIIARDGRYFGRIWVYRDITDRKLAEVEIRFNEQRYRSLVEATSAIVWDTPASGEFTVDQPGWTAFTGQTFDELRGSGWLNAIHPEDRAETARIWSAAVANRSPYEVEHRMQIRDKTYRNMLVRAVPILGEDGTIRQWVGIHTDITERKKLEHQFLRAQRLESIGTLAGGIAHDLNNVLAPIMMSIDLLSMKYTDPASQELLATLHSSAQRGADMVRQVLSFARGVEGRHMEVQPRHVIRDVEKIANDTFPKNIQVRTILANNMWTIMGDPTQVHQVLLNLCVNARDAMPEGGILTLSAENIEVDEHYAGLVAEAKSGPYLLLQVEDTGSGMAPGIIDKIFDPFFTTKEVGKGTGLGLSTSLAIVKSHGGFLRVYSELGKGTKFKIYFPARTEASPGTTEEIAPEMPRGNGEIILVVDDEASVRQITQQTLQAFGYRVILATDGIEAISIFSRQGPEIAVVLTDMMMPVMDGPALVRILRKLKPTLQIIGASGLTATTNISRSGSLGINHFLPKPYMASELLKILREILSANKALSGLGSPPPA